jgi:hypothetical protein
MFIAGLRGEREAGAPDMAVWKHLESWEKHSWGGGQDTMVFSVNRRTKARPEAASGHAVRLARAWPAGASLA